MVISSLVGFTTSVFVACASTISGLKVLIIRVKNVSLFV